MNSMEHQICQSHPLGTVNACNNIIYGKTNNEIIKKFDLTVSLEEKSRDHKGYHSASCREHKWI